MLMLANSLRTKLDETDQISTAFHSWLLVLGGIATSGKDEEHWFAARLAELYPQRENIDGRQLRKHVPQLMARFVWMDIACNDGFLNLWFEVDKAASKASPEIHEPAAFDKW